MRKNYYKRYIERYDLTDEQKETIERIEDKIKDFVPGFDKKLKMELDRQEQLQEQTFC